MHFPSTGATNVTVGTSFDRRDLTSLNYLLLNALLADGGGGGSVASNFSTNNLNHSGRLYGVTSQRNLRRRLLCGETHVVDANDKFPSIKFSIPHGDNVKKFQLFLPSLNCNTQFQSEETLRATGASFLDILLRYVGFDERLCRRCVGLELRVGRKLTEKERERARNEHQS